MAIDTITWQNGRVRLIDQTKLPLDLEYIETDDYRIIAEAIRRLSVRGAPAIGIAAAFAVVLGIQKFDTGSRREFIEHTKQIIQYMGETRPTAVNLFWALRRMERILEAAADVGISELKRMLLDQALTIFEEDKRICRELGKQGASLVNDGDTILTHCNAGGLATADYGTALGVIYAAVEQGKKVNVFADETRPLLQGARLTTWELMQNEIEVTLICDNTAAFVMQQRKIDKIFVGADRIAANGDTANKVGTYNLAVLADYHNIPFYIVAPISTVDIDIARGTEIPIEERAAAEVTAGFGKRTAPENVVVYSPAFDVTPWQLITGIVTEQGVIKSPFEQKLKKFKNNT